MRMIYLLAFSILCMSHVKTSADEQPNILIYGEGTIQISSSLSDYEDPVANTPLDGLVMVTHDKNQKIDPNSFQIGTKKLPVQFQQSTQMSDTSPIVISIFKFTLDGMVSGNYTLEPISVKVEGKDYQAPPLIIEIP